MGMRDHSISIEHRKDSRVPVNNLQAHRGLAPATLRTERYQRPNIARILAPTPEGAAAATGSSSGSSDSDE